MFNIIVGHINEASPHFIDETKEQIDQLLLAGIQSPNTIIMVRFVELSVHLALTSEKLC